MNSKILEKELRIDEELQDDSVITTYLNLVSENIKSNNKKITRNSFWLVLSFLFYILIKDYEDSLETISIQFVTLKNNLLLLNLIPVFFSFLFFQNIALWNNNINLISLFDKLSSRLFKLPVLSDTKNVIKPFSFLHHVVNYQYKNKRVNEILKIPLTIVFLTVIIFPLLFQVYAIYQIAINNYPTFVSISCAVLTSILLLSSIIQAVSNR
ncbi:hypothetical protein DFQ05_1343 [Winogradskyella wandonensis]|uniref:Uncharacterized protein n=1 Tax=Winogradskyella wandonensis TaxID=1442586 RepID=A0A4R1KR83_9FLAO|nr:hypothetical protein [Winogradskyella wandonensis]TCK67565.1 hypothetical protein DFQ05_1343 [Winogradskyella wandonensis]